MWGWIWFLAGTAALLLWMSRAQPFPEIGSRWAWAMLSLAAVLALSTNSPRLTSEETPIAIAGCMGALGIVIGVIHDRWNRDVIVAPFAGMWFVAATIAILTDGWESYSSAEQWFGFFVATTVILLEIFLFWKGLVIGVQGRSWSQAALRQLDRGLIEGERGAISMFEKSWSVDESWLDAMSHAALIRIHEHRGDLVAANKHRDLLERLGGESGIEGAWIEKIDSSLADLALSVSECE
ncbi:MAG: hypothetical protein VYA86_02820 [Candidatus Thermoplasmatota archaeon]|nr:hypothetical protein [Candidatus Thermoplasmatota archaeon]